MGPRNASRHREVFYRLTQLTSQYAITVTMRQRPLRTEDTLFEADLSPPDCGSRRELSAELLMIILAFTRRYPNIYLVTIEGGCLGTKVCGARSRWVHGDIICYLRVLDL